METQYNPSDIETKWYDLWEKLGYFKPDFSKQQNFSIQLPPPNVTGSLHMGHAYNQTIMDILVRYHRMLGFNTCWIPGVDHAGIATQIVVERQLLQQNINRLDLGRDKFIEKVYEWKDLYGNKITNQIRRIGSSIDWSREYFSMDDIRSSVTTEIFVRLYNQGLIYRSKRLINWDPILGTALSEIEILNIEQNGSMWEIKYPLVDEHDKYVVIATTRPETLLGDVALAVNPKDERYRKLIGKKVILPLVNRELTIIADEYVDPDFGTGIVKITPAHDFNDYEVGKRHNQNLVNIFNLKAQVLEKAQVYDLKGQIIDYFELPKEYVGLDRFIARKKIIKDLENKGYLVSTKAHKLVIPKGDRTGTIIEPMLSDQWFIDVHKVAQDDNMSLAKKAKTAVASGKIKFVPNNWVNTYNQWMDNIEDWCISRQLWWGHQIPAWYDEKGNVFVAHNEEEAKKIAGNNVSLVRDKDVLDTWFTAASAPFSTLGWPNDTEEMKAFLPSSVLVTGYEIIFFWVARMIMFTTHFTGRVPFEKVYMHGMVLDYSGKKMSKSEGNVIDPIDVIEGIDLDGLIVKRTTGLRRPELASKIEENTKKAYKDGISAYGADALRFTMASYASLGRSINFDLKRCEGYRNFCNKLWNATRFIFVALENNNINLNDNFNINYSFVDEWIMSILQKLINNVSLALNNFRLDLATQYLYEFTWDEFCSWYLEFIKLHLNNGNKDIVLTSANVFLETLEILLRLLHPIIPFITEELWQKVISLLNISSQKSIMISTWPEANNAKISITSEEEVAKLQEVTNIIRNLRAQLNLKPSQKAPLLIEGYDIPEIFFPYIKELAKLSDINIIDKLPNNDLPIVVFNSTRLLLEIEIDINDEIRRLEIDKNKINKQVEKLKGKLSNLEYKKRAPSNLVAKDENDLHQLQNQLDKILLQIEELKKLK